MNLPLTPDFFKDIAAYQELKNYDREDKDTWFAEKCLLDWCASDKHQHIASSLRQSSVIDVLKDYYQDKLSTRDIGYMAVPEPVMEALVLRGYASGDRERIQFKGSGLIAGRIIRGTRFMSFPYRLKYDLWVWLWWLVLLLAFIILLKEASPLLSGIWNELLLILDKLQ
jgi:hypothetical protein